jgi:hypothetical protein
MQQTTTTSAQTVDPAGRRRRLPLLGVLVIASVVLALGWPGVATASPAHGPPHGGACRTPAIEVRATGVPFRDQRNIQRGIDAGQDTGRCVRLIGQFHVGFCVLCLKITGPVTLMGVGDPSGPSPDPRRVTVVRATGGLGLLTIDEPPDAPAGLVRVSNIWWRGSSVIGIAMENFYRGTLQLDHNRVTDIRERLRFRFAIGGSTAILPTSQALEGNFIATDNYLDTTTNPFIRGDDNGIAFQDAFFDNIEITRNTVITNGESLEIEGGAGSSYTISDNVISSTRRFDSVFANVVQTVGFPRLHGGHPAAIKLAGLDVDHLAVERNVLTVGGGSSTMVCIMAYAAQGLTPTPGSTTRIAGNRCTMDGIFAGLLGGWAGELPFFPPGPLDDAVVTGNTFVGSAAFGVTMMDFRIPLAPANDLVNTSHGNVITGNDFSGFVPSEASLYLGPSTHDNTFVGNPHGPVVNLGTNNHITVTP